MENWGLQELLLLIFVVLFLVPLIFFLIALQNTLKAVEPENRTMPPTNVWLLLIPFLGVIWAFVVVNAITNSCKTQLEQYGVYSEQKPAYSIGLAWAICLGLSIFFGMFSIPTFILLIAYWAKVHELRKQLLALKQVHENKEDGSVL